MAQPVLSFGSSEEVLALLENESRLQQETAACASHDVSALAFSDEVVQHLLSMLAKPEQPVISQSAQLPVIAETPGSTNPEPPTKLCPNVLQTRSFPLSPQSQSPGGRSVLTARNVNCTADATESRSWDSMLHLLMGNSASESRRNSTGSLQGQSLSGFRIPQACSMTVLIS